MTDDARPWRVLLVDDDPMVLRLMARLLRKAQPSWTVETAERGAQALEAMGRMPFDAVVSDLDMPGMRGSTLLEVVAERHPGTLRLIHSGSVQLEHNLEAAAVSHQFHGKPAAPQGLVAALERVHRLRSTLRDPRLQALVARIDRLPSIPQVYERLLAEMRAPEPSLRNVGRIIAEDVAMTAKVLQLVNSALFGLRSRVADPVQAAAVLGLNTLRTLVLGLELFSGFRGDDVARRHVERLWHHSTAAAGLARRIASTPRRERAVADEAFLAGMVHDVGKLVLWSALPTEYAEVHEAAFGDRRLLHDVEQECFGAHHGQVGAYLLALWGFETPTIDAVGWHHRPEAGITADDGFTPLAAVHVADALVHRHDPGSCSAEVPIDAGYLAHAGLDGQLPVWESLSQGEDALRETG
ncbi:MAG: HDOD domain-containing protein [Planctomycetota bacterium]|nr:MAG: HDOD domain-containing protein [Planctomycetota bacterium]